MNNNIIDIIKLIIEISLVLSQLINILIIYLLNKLKSLKILRISKFFFFFYHHFFRNLEEIKKKIKL